MLEIGTARAKKGEKAFGYIPVGETVSRIPVHIPINIVRGVGDGPTLAVVAMIHGTEANGGMGVAKVLREIDPQKLRGTLLAVPVANTSAYEFGQRVTEWDRKDMNRVGKGKVNGSVSERLAYTLYTDIIRKADTFIDIHSGRPTSYVWYTIYDSDVADADAEVVQQSRQMALAFGLEQVFAKTPWHGTLSQETVRDGIPTIIPEVGGGPDWFNGDERQITACARGITNVMKRLGMLQGSIKTESPRCTVWDAHTEIEAGNLSGLFLLEAERGQRLQRGDTYGVMYDPYTGEEIGQILAPADGTVLNTGVVWPVVRSNQWLGVLGDKVEEVVLNFE
jgi:predicted deacylase